LKYTHRPEPDRLLAFVREGDTVVVHSMDRLARNLDDLRRLVQTLTAPSAASASSSSKKGCEMAAGDTTVGSTPTSHGTVSANLLQ